jgi:anti-sigma B factor antagonist
MIRNNPAGKGNGSEGFMKIETKKEGNVYFIKLIGEFTISTTEGLGEKFNSILDEKPIAIAFDCEDLKYIDSSGTGTLIKCLKKARKSNTNLHYVSVNDTILNFFTVARLNSFFNILSREDFNKKYLDTEIDDLIDSL